jgi:hypothetical protein
VKLFLCESVNNPCGGVIINSGNNRFCTKSKCGVKSHKSSKVVLQDNHLYIMGNRKHQALLEPSMDSAKLNDGVAPQVFVNRIKPTNVWRTFFTSEADRVERNVNIENATSDQSWEDVESPSLEKLSEVDFAYQTPKRLKVGILLEAVADTIPVGVGKTEILEPIEDPVLVESGPGREAAEM